MTDTATWPSVSPAMTPVPYRVRSRVTENRDTATLGLEPVRERLSTPEPGEFMMIYAFGIGEVAISVSGDPTVTDGTITHTIRSVGAVSRALHDAEPGAVIGMRGPFGTNWGVDEAVGRDRYGRVALIAGARSHDDSFSGRNFRTGRGAAPSRCT